MPIPRKPLSWVLVAPLLVVFLGTGCASSSTAGNKVFQEGLKQAEGGNVKSAMKTFNSGLKTHPDHIRMRFELARLQYESGESFHASERVAMRKSADFAERGRRKEALSNRRRGNEQRAKALPYYSAARKNLRIVADAEEDDQRVAWAYFLLMRCSVFFEIWDEAYDDIDQAIILGRPTGPLLSQWREFQAVLKEKLGPDVNR